VNVETVTVGVLTRIFAPMCLLFIQAEKSSKRGIRCANEIYKLHCYILPYSGPLPRLKPIQYINVDYQVQFGSMSFEFFDFDLGNDRQHRVALSRDIVNGLWKMHTRNVLKTDKR
jgi:hypothetical protein